MAFQAKNVLGANDRVRIAIIGLRGRGGDHIKTYSGIPNVEIAAICDVDDSQIAKQARRDLGKGGAPSEADRLSATTASCWKTNRLMPFRWPRRIIGIL